MIICDVLSKKMEFENFMQNTILKDRAMCTIMKLKR